MKVLGINVSNVITRQYKQIIFNSISSLYMKALNIHVKNAITSPHIQVIFKGMQSQCIDTYLKLMPAMHVV